MGGAMCIWSAAMWYKVVLFGASECGSVVGLDAVCVTQVSMTRTGQHGGQRRAV